MRKGMDQQSLSSVGAGCAVQKHLTLATEKPCDLQYKPAGYNLGKWTADRRHIRVWNIQASGTEDYHGDSTAEGEGRQDVFVKTSWLD